MSNKYLSTIGLEIHAELKTASKMFCDCKNDPEEKRPNVNVCPVCLAHPGVLPVPNKKAIEDLISVGLAVGGKIPDVSKFDRKNYFYPDLPKGYQISQYDEPLVSGGELAGVKITRVHLEEDTGRSQHVGNSSLVDFNRAGVPLMELVTDPVIHDEDTALRFAKELQLLLRYLGVSDADMEKGQMRVEANISISEKQTATGDKKLGTKVEVKNLNSFRAVKNAIAYELVRQEEKLEAGEKVVQETRGWNEATQKTFSQRIKEEAHDYRYFPEPDIPPLDLSEFNLGKLKIALPELPETKRVRFSREFGFSPEKTEILVADQFLADYFEKTYSEYMAFFNEGERSALSPDLVFNYLTSDLLGLTNFAGIRFGELKFRPQDFAQLMYFVKTDKISSRTAKDILKAMFETGRDPDDILKNEGLEQVSGEEELMKVVREIISTHQNVVSDFKSGKTNALQFLVGQAMRRLGGRGNPLILRKLFESELRS